MVEKRRTIEFLPGVNRTTTLQKFFHATVDHLFQVHAVDALDGYIGRRPLYADPERDFYIAEPNAVREQYSLEPVAVSVDASDAITHVLFYSDLIDHLRFQGGLVDNHDRLFGSESYSWCPPINVDAFLNFRQYYWMPDGPDPVELLSPTNMDVDYVGQQSSEIAYRGYYYWPTDDRALPPHDGAEEPLWFSSGMRIKVTDDANWPHYNEQIFIVEGVGRSLLLLPDPAPADLPGWDDEAWGGGVWSATGEPGRSRLGDYIVMERGAVDGNPWSTGNRWFHRDLIPTAVRGTDKAVQASRPIVEFHRDLELFNYGRRTIGAVDAKDDLLTADDLTGYVFDDPGLRNLGFAPLILDPQNGARFPDHPDYSTSRGAMIRDGMVVLLNEASAAYRARAYRVGGIETSGRILLSAISLSETGSAEIGDMVRVRYGDNNGGRSFLFGPDGQWSAVQNKIDQYGRNIINVAPKFRLYDLDGVALDDVGRYDGSDFAGNEIFSYAAGDDAERDDPVLQRALKYRTGTIKSEIVFENDLLINSYNAATGPIEGYYFYRVLSDRQDYFGNGWHKTPVETVQPIEQTIFVTNAADPILLPFDVTLKREKPRVRAASLVSVDLTPAATLVIDGVAIEEGDRVLLMGQEVMAENGLYLAVRDSSVILLGRPEDGDAVAGDFVWVAEGDLRDTAWNAGGSWQQLYGPAPFVPPVEVFVNAQTMRPEIDYTVEAGLVRFTALKKNDVVRIRTYSRNEPVRNVGAYVVPLNLQANPNFAEMNGEITHSDVFDHFASTISNQKDLRGDPTGINNYRDTARLASLGSWIVQHRSPLLRTMLLSSDRNIDLALSLEHGEREYNRFRNKFIRKIAEMLRVNSVLGDPRDVVDRALDDLALGRTTDFPFAHSDMVPGGSQAITASYEFALAVGTAAYRVPETAVRSAQLGSALIWLHRAGRYRLLTRDVDFTTADDQVRLAMRVEVGDRIAVRLYGSATFVPPSPSHLGLYPLYRPHFHVDDTLMTPRRFVVGHDGVFIDAFEDASAGILNEVLLEFEQRIYNSTASRFRTAGPVFEPRSYVGGKFRANRYTYEEWNEVLRPFFERWASISRVDYRANRTVSESPFSWNYRGLLAQDGEILVGHWRGIYHRYFDTDRPHTHPWEMLGFSIKPDWWDAEYGGAPYTRGNRLMWRDLRDGYIRNGPRRGIDTRYARSSLYRFIPVDEYGVLLDPVAAGIAGRAPTAAEAERPWQFGDHGPAETTWRRSSVYPFAHTMASYLLRPAEFVEAAWDSLDTEIVLAQQQGEQFLSRRSRRRASLAQQHVHGELLDDGTTRQAIGLQQFVSDYVKSRGQNVTLALGDVLRGADVRLAHKMAGFVDSGTMRVRADNFGFVPQENIRHLLHRSPSVAEYSYGGVIIEWTGRSWRVAGYDGLDPFFNIIPHDLNGRRTSITIGGIPPFTADDWTPNTYYVAGAKVKYNGGFYAAGSEHNSGPTFDSDRWSSFDPPENFGGTTVTWYRDANRDGNVLRIPYGVEYQTKQDVFDFVNNYGRWLDQQGWIFDTVNVTTQETLDWLSVGKDFIFWSETQWQPGSAIALSPAATQVKFRRDFGEIQPVEQIVHGLYSLLDRDGSPILPQETTVSRMDGEVTILPNADNALYMVRLFVSEIEHVLIFDNRTVFGDLIYDPLLNLRQPRLKLSASRSADWNGRVDAPGYVVNDEPGLRARPASTMVANFEKTAEDFRRYYDIERPPERQLITDHARHLVGYQRRSYLNDLFLVPAVQFEFYQGMIREKGTRKSLRALLRSLFVSEAEDVQFYDEWLFRVAQYGGQGNRLSFAVFLSQNEVKSNPVLVSFERYNEALADISSDDVINIPMPNPTDPDSRDSRWVILPEAELKHPFDVLRYDRHIAGIPVWTEQHPSYPSATIVKFHGIYFRAVRDVPTGIVRDDPALSFDLEVADAYWLPDRYMPGWLPTSGYARLDEVKYAAFDLADFNALTEETFPRTPEMLTEGDRILLYIDDLCDWAIDDACDWQVYRACRLETGVHTASVGNFAGASRLHTIEPADLREHDLIFVNADLFNVNFRGIIRVLGKLGPTEFDLGTLPVENFDWAGEDEIGPEIFLLRSVRFRHHSDLATPVRGGWSDGDLAFVDSGTRAGRLTPGWHTVYRRDGSGWIELRSEESRVDSSLLRSATIYDRLSDEPRVTMTAYDPIKGILPGAAERELWYKLEIDPAKYTDGNAEIHQIDPGQAWGPEQVGRLWWDISRVRFVDYEVSDSRYRRAAWGRVAPRTSVDIYEWVRSPVPPASWAGYVEEASRESDERFDYKPAGQIKDPENPAWVSRTEYSLERDAYAVFYYFWVKNSPTRPKQLFRSMSALEVSRAITNPRAAGFPFFAAVNPSSVLVGNVEQFLDDRNSVLQVDYVRRSTDENVHSHWLLMREGDPSSQPDPLLWAKMRDSLVGFNAVGQPVPDPSLSEVERYGSAVRPRQSWFKETYSETDSFGQPNFIERDGRPLASRLARRVFVDKLNALLAVNPVTQRQEGWKQALVLSDAVPQRTFKVPTAATPIGHPTSVRLVCVRPVDLVDHDVYAVIDDALLRDGDWVLLVAQVNHGENGVYRWNADNSRLEIAPLSAELYETGRLFRAAEGAQLRDSVWIVTEPGPARRFEQWTAGNEYHQQVERIADLQALLDDPEVGVAVGEQVLVATNPVSGAPWWSIWRYGGPSGGWTLTGVQRYDVNDIWEDADWYAEGFSARSTPRFSYSSETARELHRAMFGIGDLIAISDQSGFTWHVYEGLGQNGRGKYRLVAAQGGTIAFKPLLYTAAAVVSRNESLDGRSPGEMTDFFTRVSLRDGSEELRVLLDGLLDNAEGGLLTQAEINALFFTMVHFAYSQHPTIDWAIKSSYLAIRGINEPLKQSPIMEPDITESLLSYVDEVKPYHTKVRDYTVSRYLPIVEGSFWVSDFDKPVWPGPSADSATTIGVDWATNNSTIHFPYSATHFAESRWHQDWHEHFDIAEKKIQADKVRLTLAAGSTEFSIEDADKRITEYLDHIGQEASVIVVAFYRDIADDTLGMVLRAGAANHAGSIELITIDDLPSGAGLAGRTANVQIGPTGPGRMAGNMSWNGNSEGFALTRLGNQFDFNLRVENAAVGMEWKFLNGLGIPLYFSVQSNPQVQLRATSKTVSVRDNNPVRQIQTRLHFDRNDWIDWHVAGKAEFDDLYARQFGRRNRRGTDRAVIPGHLVFAKNHDDRDVDGWKIFRLVRPNLAATTIAGIEPGDPGDPGEMVLRTHLPHRIDATPVEPATHVVVATPLPNAVVTATGRRAEYDLPHPISASKLRVAVGGRLLAEQDYEPTKMVAESSLYTAVKFIRRKPAKGDAISFYDLDAPGLFGTFAITGVPNAQTVVVAYDEAVEAMQFAPGQITSEIYLYRPTYREDIERGHVSTLDQDADLSNLNAAERLAVLGDWIDLEDHRTVLGADFKGIIVEGTSAQGTAEHCDPVFADTFVYRSNPPFGRAGVFPLVSLHSGWDDPSHPWGCGWDADAAPGNYHVRVTINGMPTVAFEVLRDALDVVARYDPLGTTPMDHTWKLDRLNEFDFRLPVGLPDATGVQVRLIDNDGLADDLADAGSRPVAFNVDGDIVRLEALPSASDAVLVFFPGPKTFKISLHEGTATDGDLIGVEVVPARDSRDTTLVGGSIIRLGEDGVVPGVSTGPDDIIVEGGLRLPGPTEVFVADGTTATFALANTPLLGTIAEVGGLAGVDPTTTARHPDYNWHIRVYRDTVALPESGYALIHEGGQWKLEVPEMPALGTEFRVDFLGRPAVSNPLYGEERPPELGAISANERFSLNVYQAPSSGAPMVATSVLVADGRTKIFQIPHLPANLQAMFVSIGSLDDNLMLSRVSAFGSNREDEFILRGDQIELGATPAAGSELRITTIGVGGSVVEVSSGVVETFSMRYEDDDPTWPRGPFILNNVLQRQYAIEDIQATHNQHPVAVTELTRLSDGRYRVYLDVEPNTQAGLIGITVYETPNPMPEQERVIETLIVRAVDPEWPLGTNGPFRLRNPDRVSYVANQIYATHNGQETAVTNIVPIGDEYDIFLDVPPLSGTGIVALTVFNRPVTEFTHVRTTDYVRGVDDTGGAFAVAAQNSVPTDAALVVWRKITALDVGAAGMDNNDVGRYVRLSPPRTFYLTGYQGAAFHLPLSYAVERDEVLVWVNGTATTAFEVPGQPTGDISAQGPLPTAAVGTRLRVTDEGDFAGQWQTRGSPTGWAFGPGDTITAMADGNWAAAMASMEQIVVFYNVTEVPQDSDEVIIAVRHPHDYDYHVDDGLLYLAPTVHGGTFVGGLPMRASDTIRVLSFGHDETLGIRTEVFDGRPSGHYGLSQRPWDFTATWVGLNGRDQLYGRDFDVVDRSLGWDVYPLEGETFDAAEQRAKVRLFSEQSVTDRVVVTSLASREQRPSLSFSLVQDPMGSWNYLRNSADHVARLREPLNWFDRHVSLDDVTMLLPSDAIDDTIALPAPAAVLIGSERIEYDRIDVPGRRLLGVRRATGGSSGGVLNRYDSTSPASTPVGNNVQRSFDFILRSGEWPLSRQHVAIKAYHGSRLVKEYDWRDYSDRPAEYVIDDLGPTITVTFAEPPPLGWKLVLAATVQNWRELGESYPVGTEVVDSGPRQAIPGSYRWLGEPLQYSEKPMAAFLREHQGIHHDSTP